MSELNKDTSIENTPKKAFILPSRTLRLLDGVLKEHELPTGRKLSLVEEGAYLWGVPHLTVEKVQAVFNHSCLVGRGAWYMTKALKERSRQLGDGKYTDENLKEGLAAEAGVIHDAIKMHSGQAFEPKDGSFWIPGIEDLTAEEKQALGYPSDYREISPEADEILIGWLKKQGFPGEIINVVIGHDFPEDPKATETIYQKIIMWTDFSISQEFGTVRERLDDVFNRWIMQFVTNKEQFSGQSPTGVVRDHWQELEFEPQKPPRIKPERAAKSVEIIEGVARELFDYLGISEEEFVERCRLNDVSSIPPWEKVLRKSWQRDYISQQKGITEAPEAERIKRVLKKKGL